MLFCSILVTCHYMHDLYVHVCDGVWPPQQPSTCTVFVFVALICKTSPADTESKRLPCLVISDSAESSSCLLINVAPLGHPPSALTIYAYSGGTLGCRNCQGHRLGCSEDPTWSPPAAVSQTCGCEGSWELRTQFSTALVSSQPSASVLQMTARAPWPTKQFMTRVLSERALAEPCCCLPYGRREDVSFTPTTVSAATPRLVEPDLYFLSLSLLEKNLRKPEDAPRKPSLTFLFLYSVFRTIKNENLAKEAGCNC